MWYVASGYKHTVTNVECLMKKIPLFDILGCNLIWGCNAGQSHGLSLCLEYSLLISGLFTQTPVSVNSTPNATVHFTCTVERGIPFWRINGLGLWQLPSTASLRITTQSYDGGHSSSVMYILTPEIYNNSIIQCVVFTTDGEIGSALVELKVQGQSI